MKIHYYNGGHSAVSIGIKYDAGVQVFWEKSKWGKAGLYEHITGYSHIQLEHMYTADWSLYKERYEKMGRDRIDFGLHRHYLCLRSKKPKGYLKHRILLHTSGLRSKEDLSLY